MSVAFNVTVFLLNISLFRRVRVFVAASLGFLCRRLLYCANSVISTAKLRQDDGAGNVSHLDAFCVNERFFLLDFRLVERKYVVVDAVGQCSGYQFWSDCTWSDR